MEDDVKTTTHAVSSPADHIQFHHDTEKQGRSLIHRYNYFSDTPTCVYVQYRRIRTSQTGEFRVRDIPEECPRPTTPFRIKRKLFARACHPTMPSVSQFMKSMNTECCCSLRSAIDKHIQDVFYKRIQYVCISSPCNPSSSPRVVYVLITHGRNAMQRSSDV